MAFQALKALYYRMYIGAAVGCLPLVFYGSLAFSADKPAQISGVIKAEAPYGKGSLTLFFLHIYDAKLWSDGELTDYKNPLALDITYRISISANTLVDKTMEQMEHIRSLSDSEKKQYYSVFTSAFCDVKDGDHILAVYIPGKGTSFYCKSVFKIHIASEDFSHEFFDIWLSEKTAEPGLREQLLGLSQ